jgi:hypothetical protein
MTKLVIAEGIMPFLPQLLLLFQIVVIHEAAAAEVLCEELPL